MNFDITSKTDNLLLSRIEVAGEISFEKATPSGADVKVAAAKKLGVEQNLIALKGIYMSYGQHSAKVFLHQYTTKDDLKNIERVTEKTESSPKEEKKDSSKTEEKPKEETPKTEEKPKKEAPKAGEKPKEETPKTEEKPKQDSPKTEKKPPKGEPETKDSAKDAKK